MVGWINRRLRRDREDGAALVEMALVLPFLLLLLIGTMEAGWAFSNHLEVRHGAREGARLAAVSANPYTTANLIALETCSRMTSASPDVSVTLDLPSGASDPAALGEVAEITVARNHSSLTSFLPFFDGLALSSTVEIRLEQAATWGGGVPYEMLCDGTPVP